MMSGENALRIAIVGLGTVGGGVIRLLETNRDLITRRAGRPITITAISARDRTKDRGVDLSPYEWVDDMSELAGREDIDAIVELIGGADGPALTLSRQCLAAHKPFITSTTSTTRLVGKECVLTFRFRVLLLL